MGLLEVIGIVLLILNLVGHTAIAWIWIILLLCSSLIIALTVGMISIVFNVLLHKRKWNYGRDKRR